MNKWQSIETAPKDGSPVWAKVHHERSHWTRVGWIYWGPVQNGNKIDEGWIIGDFSFNRFDAHPTHWMPLPEPPADE